MKPYIVFKSAASLLDVGFRPERGMLPPDSAPLVYIPSGDQSDSHNWSDRDWLLWEFDTEGAARAFAHFMSSKHPNIPYCWAETKGMFQSAPAAPKEAKISKQGVLPA